jgi:hypothetical protein
MGAPFDQGTVKGKGTTDLQGCWAVALELVKASWGKHQRYTAALRGTPRCNDVSILEKKAESQAHWEILVAGATVFADPLIFEPDLVANLIVYWRTDLGVPGPPIPQLELEHIA